MERYIKVGKEFRTYVKEPLIASDVRAYKIVWDTKSGRSDMALLVTAKRADGVTVTDMGTFKNGVGEYVLAGNMYSVPGNVEIRVSVLENTSVLTEKFLVFEVLEGNNSEQAIEAETNMPVLNTMTIKIADLYNIVSNIPTKTSDLTNDSGFITEEVVPTKTSDLTNDSGFITEEVVPTKTSDLTNDSDYITKDVLPAITGRWEYTHNSTEKEAQFILNNTVSNPLTNFSLKGPFSGRLYFSITKLSGNGTYFFDVTDVFQEDDELFVKEDRVYRKTNGEVTDITDDGDYIAITSRIKGLKTWNDKSVITVKAFDETINGTLTEASMQGCRISFEYSRIGIPSKTSELNNDEGFISYDEAEERYVAKEEGKGLSTADYHPIENIANITSEEGVTTFNISKDINNNDFKLDEVFIYIRRPSALDDDYTWWCYANGLTSSSYALFVGKPVKTLNTLSFHSQRLQEDLWQTEELQKNTSSGMTIGYAMSSVNYITSLQLSLSGLPAGSTIVICGRRVE